MSTYYVQAVVRDSVSDEIIDTINLTDRGNGRFTKVWEVPADISGLGFYIDITTSVYTDSGYSTKADTYGDEVDSYLVFDRIVNRGGGSGGSDVDYKKIEKILVQTVKPLLDRKEINLDPILTQIKGVLTAVKGIEIPTPEKLDNSAVISAISQSEKVIVKAIEDKEVTEKTELAPLQEAIIDAINEKEPELAPVIEKIDEVHETLKEFIQYDAEREDMSESTAVSKLKGIMDIIETAPKKEQETEDEKPARDERITKLIGDNTDE